MLQQSMKLGFTRPKSNHTTATHLVVSQYIHIKKTKPVPSRAFDTYWKFAHKRQEIFFKKIADPKSLVLTDDPVLRRHRFTNVYRVSDRVSQYLIRSVQYGKRRSFEDIIFRTLLFKMFNKIETWEHLERKIGEITWREGILKEISILLDEAFAKKVTLYSAAYIMPSSKSKFGHERKHNNHLDLLEFIMSKQELEKIQNAKTLGELYNTVKNLPGIGPFLAYQYAIDLNYSEYFNFCENDFVKAGPGAIDGIRKCFVDLGDYTTSDIIKLMVDMQEQAFSALNLSFQYLWGRSLHLIDCQNLFCETDKYCRVVHPDIVVGTGRSRIKQIYKTNPEPYEFYFPPKWNLLTNHQ